ATSAWQSAKNMRRLLYTEARDLTNQVALIEHYLINHILDNAFRWCASLVGAADRYLVGKRFDWVVIDKASQALVTTWIPIAKAHKVLFAGDPFQPHYRKSFDAERKGIGQTIIGKSRLHISAQSEPPRCSIPYERTDCKLSRTAIFTTTAPSARVGKRGNCPAQRKNQPVEFVDTASCGFEKKTPKQQAYSKAALLWKHLEQLLQHQRRLAFPFHLVSFRPTKRGSFIYKICSTITASNNSNSPTININTIDSFSGSRRRDIVIFLLVRSNENIRHRVFELSPV
ncbi:MAG: hypothetical protein IPL35_04245, partial [Sphingobacteriales bacterium]|nr:hypothetical protein [Sphingobacteriales bacterium]